MMGRCYSEKFHEQFPSYKDVTVCERWHCFQNFCEDIKNLHGYDNWINNSGYELDKDTLCEKMNIKPKIYSPETCMFISKNNNVSESTSRKNLTGLTYEGISPTGERYEFTNISEFATIHELNHSLVNACIKGTRKHHKNWMFNVKE